MSITIFVTGTNTAVGKTYVSQGLLRGLNQQGYSTLGLKPVATGCFFQDGTWFNEDALFLQQAASLSLPYAVVNPYALELPVSPHLAAAQAGMQLTVANLITSTQNALVQTADMVLIEGAGGWYVPLNQHETMADFVAQMQLPVILVIGMRLGCLNHALLTYEAIKLRGITLLGWVANCIDPDMLLLAENIATLTERIAAPCLGIIPNQIPPETAIDFNQLHHLLSKQKLHPKKIPEYGHPPAQAINVRAG